MSAVDHPAHYNAHPSGVEAIVVCERMTFCIGSAMKYLWRAGLKDADPTEDLRKAAWYVRREIETITARGGDSLSPPGLPPSVEREQICEHMPYHVGCAMSHLWAYSFHHEPEPAVDLRGALRHVEREIKRVSSMTGRAPKQAPVDRPPAFPGIPMLRKLQERCAQEADYEVASGKMHRFDAHSAKISAKHIREIDVETWIALGCPDKEMPR